MGGGSWGTTVTIRLGECAKVATIPLLGVAEPLEAPSYAKRDHTWEPVPIDTSADPHGPRATKAHNVRAVGYSVTWCQSRTVNGIDKH